MNFQAAVKGIAPAGGIRPASHITASFVSATKAKPAAHYFVGQRSKRGAPYGVSCGRERDTAYRPVSAYNTAPHYPRHHGNPCAEKVSAHRFRQSSAPVGHRQGTLTITGSNVRLGTEMPVALSLFP